MSEELKFANFIEDVEALTRQYGYKIEEIRVK